MNNALTFRRDRGPAGVWLDAGLCGLSAALGRDCTAAPVPPDELLAAADRSLTIAPGGWFAGAGTPGLAEDSAGRLHDGWARSLVGHGKHRALDAGGLLTWTTHRKFRRDWLSPTGKLKKSVQPTRGILPGWTDDGAGWPLDQAAPLWFAPLAALALPLPKSRAVLLAPLWLDLPRAGEFCRAVAAVTPDDGHPASAADAALSLFARLDAAGVGTGHAVGWEYGFGIVKQFREIKAVHRFDHPGAALARWGRFAAATPPVRRADRPSFPQEVRGLAADNLLAGRRPYDGFERLCRDRLPWGPAARAVVEHLP